MGIRSSHNCVLQLVYNLYSLWKVCVGALHLEIQFTDFLIHVSEMCTLHEEDVVAEFLPQKML